MAYWAKVASKIRGRYFGMYNIALGSNTTWDFYETCDVLQDLLLQLIHALRTHDAQRGPLAPHVWHVLWRDCSYALQSARGKHFITGVVTEEIVEDWHPRFGNRVAMQLNRVAQTEEEVVVTKVLQEYGAVEFPYQTVCERLPWWSENRETQRKSFKRVVQSCAARLPSQQVVERN